ncbi:hypothetical protein DE146DRAFT_675041 [Phaeosphaeria sp. MPI-PUGE-AT-0046c]|nr:hypothetical protein DE146DRAFT_675041 [Phaeosphaeria sp. MPI-PUGE-AT-0046c]
MKVTSLGSESSSSCYPEPHPTPAAEAFDSEVAPPPMDFAAVTKILAPITETLNESAEDAMYPSPPLNTPEVGSPTPSVAAHYCGRGRGISIVGDRLAQLKLDARMSHYHHHHRNAEVTSSSRSDGTSAAGECDECEVASISDILSETCRRKDCSGRAGSPATNPRIEEYLSFSSKDLPNQAPAPAVGASLVEHASSTTALDASQHSRASFKSDGGVTEKSNWADEVEDILELDLLRLEQLAGDEHATNQSKALEDFYIERLRRLLGSEKRIVRVDIVKSTKGTQ